MPKQLFFWGAIFWAGIITYFCLVQLNNVPLGDVTNIDKYVHAFFHFVFTALWFLFFKKHMKNRSIYKPLMFSFMLSVFFGIGIEILQELYTASRKADVFDVLANMTGAGLSVGIVLLLRNNKFLDKI